MATKNWTTVQLTLNSTDRAQIRAEVFRYWIAELPGTPTLTNAYRYNVERLSDGSQIYLTRPTRLNKGADFVILCEDFLFFKNGNPKPPTHGDLFSEFTQLGQQPVHMNELLTALRRIWDCEDSSSVIESLMHFNGNARAQRALLLAKWFFIEQDVTYWTESGRHMLRNAFEDAFGNLP
jgi:hypothetical protein